MIKKTEEKNIDKNRANRFIKNYFRNIIVSRSRKGRTTLILLLVVVVFFGLSSLKTVAGIDKTGIIAQIASAIGITANISESPSQIALEVSLNRKVTEDAQARCRVIDPYNQTNVEAKQSILGASSVFDLNGKAGINQGDTGGSANDTLNFVTGKNGTTNLNMNYIISIITDPSDIGSTVSFIKDSNKAGLIPIVRLCFIGGCKFTIDNNGGNILPFYQGINTQLANTDNIYIATLGPNEAGSGEMEGFGLKRGDYNTLVNGANKAAEQLQKERAVNGGNMYLAPAIFNITNTQVDSDDVYGYLFNSNTINPDLYDFLMGNTYNISGLGADYFYNKNTYQGNHTDYSMRDYVTKHTNLQTIITETGFFPFNSNDYSTNLNSFKTAYNNLCNDSTVDGILFFRPFPDSELKTSSPRQGPSIPAADIKNIVDSCTAQPKTFSDTKRWLNCNFNTAIYKNNVSFVGGGNSSVTQSKNDYSKYKITDINPNNPSVNSTATPFLTVPPSNNNIKVGLLIKCEGDNCHTNETTTIQVKAPVRNAGNSSALGSPNKSYEGVCALVATKLSILGFDALNQYSGQLLDETGNSYPMPWLGSAINCAANLLLVMPEFAGYRKLQFVSSPGSLNIWTPKKLVADITRYDAANLIGNIAITVPSGQSTLNSLLDSNGNHLIADERATQVLDNSSKSVTNVFDNSSDISNIQGLRDYNPFNLSPLFKTLDTGTPTDNPNHMQYFNDKKDLITGPELVVDKAKQEGNWTGGTVCAQYAVRNTNNSSIDKNFKFPDPSVSTLGCNFSRDSYVGRIKCSSLSNLGYGENILNNPKCIAAGSCRIESSYFDKYAACFSWYGNGSDKVYYNSNADYTPTPKFSIPDIYTGIYREYQRVETQVSSRNLKIIFEQNLGQKYEVSSIIRDSNKLVDSKVGPYLYAGTPNEYQPDPNLGNNPDFTTLVGSVTPSVPDNLFDNKTYLALGQPRSKTSQYYDWIGYTDYLQEVSMSYANNGSLDDSKNPTASTAELSILNPFYNQTGQPNSTQKNILITNTVAAAKYVSIPILTCDQVQICKKFSKNDLVSKFGSLLATQLCPLDKVIPEDKQLNCIANINDTRFDTQNNLQIELCKRGYDVGINCTNECIAPIDQSPTAPPGTVTCPLQQSHACFQGPYGGYTHYNESGLPVDMYPSFEGNLKGPVYTANHVRIRNIDVVTPESGVVKAIVADFYDGFSIGTHVDILGGSGILYSLHHLNPASLKAADGSKLNVGSKVVVGIKIGELGTQEDMDKYLYEDFDVHFHFSATINGAPINPYLLFGDKYLKCGIVAPNPGQVEGSLASPGQCKSYIPDTKIYLLQDNATATNHILPNCASYKGQNICFKTRIDTSASGNNSDNLVAQAFARLAGSSVTSTNQSSSTSSDATNTTTTVSSTGTTSSKPITYTKFKDGVYVALNTGSISFTASPGAVPRESITDFASQTNSDIAINTNFFSGNTPNGLEGANGSFSYQNTKYIDYTFVTFDPSKDPTGGDPHLATKLVGKTQNLAIFNSRDQDGFTNNDSKILSNNVTTAMAGFPLLVSNGKVTDPGILRQYQASSDVRPRTIIGWNQGGQLVIAVINAANFVDESNIATTELGLTFAMNLDGGSSSQMYLKSTFGSDVDSKHLYSNNTVFWPESSSATPASVESYFGIKVVVNPVTTACIGNNTNIPPTTTYDNIFKLIEKVSASTNVPKGVLASVMSTEGRAVFSISIGDVIKNSKGKVVSTNPLVLTGDPNQRSMDFDNSAKARGVMQALCQTLLTYGYPPGDYNDASVTSGVLPCYPWAYYGSDGKLISNYGAIGRNYDEVIKCVKDIGMTVQPGMHLDRGLVGHSLCIAAIELRFTQGKGKDMNTVPLDGPYDSSNAIWAAAYAYNPLKEYANQIWGRSNIFKLYWDKFVSGDYGENEIWGPSHTDNSYYCTILKGKGILNC